MDKLTFYTHIDVATPPARGRLAGGVVLAMLAIAGLVWGIVARRPIVLSMVFLLMYALGMVRSATDSRIMKPTQAMLEVQGTRLLLRLPGTKLVDRRYVTQLYLCDLEDVDGVGFLDGKMLLRAKLITSVGIDDAKVVSQRVLRQCEVSLLVDQAAAEQLATLLRRWGLPVYS